MVERIMDLGLAPSFDQKRQNRNLATIIKKSERKVSPKFETIWEEACKLVQTETTLRLKAEAKTKQQNVREGFSFGILEEEADNAHIG